VTAECDRFGRYLSGVQPGDYVRGRYVDALERFPERFSPADRLDRLLFSMSSWPMPLRAVDMTARVLSPASAVRKRLVLMTALLENAPDTFELYERPSAGGAAFFFGLATRGVVSISALLLGLVVSGLAYPLGVGRD